MQDPYNKIWKFMIKIYQIFFFLVEDLPEFIMKIAFFEMWRDLSIL